MCVPLCGCDIMASKDCLFEVLCWIDASSQEIACILNMTTSKGPFVHHDGCSSHHLVYMCLDPCSQVEFGPAVHSLDTGSVLGAVDGTTSDVGCQFQFDRISFGLFVSHWSRYHSLCSMSTCNGGLGCRDGPPLFRSRCVFLGWCNRGYILWLWISRRV